LYLYSGKNIAGCSLGLVGLGLHFAGVINALWGPIVAGLYGVGALVFPSSRSVDLREEFRTADVHKALMKLVAEVRGKVPEDIMTKVSGIADTIEGILPRVGQLDSGSPELFVLQRTATDYLPTALETYINLPRAYATVHPISGRKTAKQVLADQLDLLQAQMSGISDAVNKNDTDKLLAHGRFLEEKFGRKDLSLEPPGAAASGR